jgi:hypothetical protein
MKLNSGKMNHIIIVRTVIIWSGIRVWIQAVPNGANMLKNVCRGKLLIKKESEANERKSRFDIIAYPTVKLPINWDVPEEKNQIKQTMKLNYVRMSFAISLILILYACSQTTTEGPYLATGIKIGEVSQTEAIVWVRLTENPERIGNDAPLPEIKYKDPQTGEMVERRGRPDATPVVTYPDGHTIKTIQGASPGMEGKVRLKYKASDDQKWTKMDWLAVDLEKDFTYQFQLTDLSSGNGGGKSGWKKSQCIHGR